MEAASAEEGLAVAREGGGLMADPFLLKKGASDHRQGGGAADQEGNGGP
ncbi:hypothetical protein [Cerasicoccus arenae]|uniref:Uncharacterized protein n=1 Tax=Cerasicoccus arenae TaxID=424488 RepID=A0A8J3DHX4_9BACT|nr:hypothetical protein [Cerasicoccus arenae]MBK1858827.1 hypothetical protein [Cerasicoccus arenae]GHC04368.1 hypothetical protein GCM10007047_21360 [Cerasicoccus arenae]